MIGFAHHSSSSNKIRENSNKNIPQTSQIPQIQKERNTPSSKLLYLFTKRIVNFNNLF